MSFGLPVKNAPPEADAISRSASASAPSPYATVKMRTLVPSVTGSAAILREQLLAPDARAGAVGEHDDRIDPVRVVERAHVVERAGDRQVDGRVAVGEETADRAGHGRPALARHAQPDIRRD